MTWTQVGSVLQAYDAAVSDQFGVCAISRDGFVLAVGALTWEGAYSNQGAVYIYDRVGLAWVLRGSVMQASDPAINSYFGYSVALNDDGSRLAVGAPGAGSVGQGVVYILDYVADEWVERAIIEPGDGAASDHFGGGVAMRSAGDAVFIGAKAWEGVSGTNRGGVYIYSGDSGGETWTQVGSVLVPADASNSDNFGGSVAVSDDGLRLVVGANNTGGTAYGSVYTFDYSGIAWVQLGARIAPPTAQEWGSFGTGVCVSGDGSVLFVGSANRTVTQPDQGAVFVYAMVGGAWVYDQILVASDAAAVDFFGFSVACDRYGEHLVVGAIGWEGGNSAQGGLYTIRSSVLRQPVAELSLGSDETLPQTDAAFSEIQSVAALGGHSLQMQTFTAESATATDAATPEVIQWFLESIAASETIASTSTLTLSYADQVAAFDTLGALFEELIAESSSTLETWYLDTASLIVDVAVAAGITTSQTAAAQAMAEIVTTYETFRRVFNELTSEASSTSETVNLGTISRLLDGVAAAGITDSQLVAINTRIEAITAAVVLQPGGLKEITESADGADAVTNLLLATQGVLEQAVASELSTSYLLLVNTVSELVNTSESSSVWQSLTHAIEEGAVAFVHLVVGGADGAAEVYTGWVMNTQNGAVSEYQGLNFNSLCKIGTRYFGAASDGVYEITGTTDSGADIATYIQTGLMDFGITHDKSVSDAYLAVDIDGRIALGVRVSEKPGPAEFWYEVTMDKDAVGNVKVPIGRGLKGRYWKFEVASEALSSFDALTVLPSKLTRRV